MKYLHALKLDYDYGDDLTLAMDISVLHHIVAFRFTFAAKMLIFKNGWQATPRCLCCPKELHHHYCYAKVFATMLVKYINTNTNA